MTLRWWQASVPAVEGGISAALKRRLAEEDFPNFPMLLLAMLFPPGWKPGFTAGRMPAATIRRRGHNMLPFRCVGEIGFHSRYALPS